MKQRRGPTTTVAEDPREGTVSAQVDSLLSLGGLRADVGQTLVVLRAGDVLGVAIWRLDGRDAEVMGLVTDPNHRHRGVGRQLVQAVALRARRAGCQRLRVRLPKADDASLGFFRAVGFDDTHVALDLEL